MEPNLDEREQRIQIREAWRRARDEMREAFRTTWQEGVAENDTLKRENFEAFVQNLAAKAGEFGREVGEEARRLSQGFAHDAHHHADEAWKGVRAEWKGKHQEHHDRHHRPAGVRDHWLFGSRRFQNWAEGDGDANPFIAAMMSKGGGLLSAYVLHLLAE
ncbi:MAG: hypothetical protein Q7O66_06640, partial [Dehalococcoidia bacterium]|nr:hypothetical protein [Dehalococcoidia bacterium]